MFRLGRLLLLLELLLVVAPPAIGQLADEARIAESGRRGFRYSRDNVNPANPLLAIDAAPQQCKGSITLTKQGHAPVIDRKPDGEPIRGPAPDYKRPLINEPVTVKLENGTVVRLCDQDFTVPPNSNVTFWAAPGEFSFECKGEGVAYPECGVPYGYRCWEEIWVFCFLLSDYTTTSTTTTTTTTTTPDPPTSPTPPSINANKDKLSSMSLTIALAANLLTNIKTTAATVSTEKTTFAHPDAIDCQKNSTIEGCNNSSMPPPLETTADRQDYTSPSETLPTTRQQEEKATTGRPCDEATIGCTTTPNITVQVGPVPTCNGTSRLPSNGKPIPLPGGTSTSTTTSAATTIALFDNGTIVTLHNGSSVNVCADDFIAPPNSTISVASHYDTLEVKCWNDITTILCNDSHKLICRGPITVTCVKLGQTPDPYNATRSSTAATFIVVDKDEAFPWLLMIIGISFLIVVCAAAIFAKFYVRYKFTNKTKKRADVEAPIQLKNSPGPSTPAKSAKPAEPAKPVKPSKPTKSPKPAKCTKPSKPSKSNSSEEEPDSAGKGEPPFVLPPGTFKYKAGFKINNGYTGNWEHRRPPAIMDDDGSVSSIEIKWDDDDNQYWEFGVNDLDVWNAMEEEEETQMSRSEDEVPERHLRGDRDDPSSTTVCDDDLEEAEKRAKLMKKKRGGVTRHKAAVSTAATNTKKHRPARRARR